MKNIEMTIEGNVLTLIVHLNKNFGKSKRGKSIIIASTQGNQPLPGIEDIMIGMNVYTHAASAKPFTATIEG